MRDGIASVKSSTTVPIDDVRSFLETGTFRGEPTDTLQAMLRKGMVKTDEDRRAKVKTYADAFVTKRRASKQVFPIKPDKLSKPTGPLPKIVSLEEALGRAKPRSSARGGKLTAAAAAKKKSGKRKKAPPAKKPPARAAKKPAYSPSFP